MLFFTVAVYKNNTVGVMLALPCKKYILKCTNK